MNRDITSFSVFPRRLPAALFGAFCMALGGCVHERFQPDAGVTEDRPEVPDLTLVDDRQDVALPPDDGRGVEVIDTPGDLDVSARDVFDADVFVDGDVVGADRDVPDADVPTVPDVPTVEERRSCRPMADGGIPAGCGGGLVEVPGGTFTMGSNVSCERDAGAGVCDHYADPAQENVRVDRFAMDAYEVTVARFREFWRASRDPNGLIRYPGGATPRSIAWDGPSTVTPPMLRTEPGNEAFNWSEMPGDRENHPINGVDWWTAQKFCVWDGGGDGSVRTTGRLPTEAEWEYAARGRAVSDDPNYGSLRPGRAFPWGDNPPTGCLDRAHWGGVPGRSCAGPSKPVGQYFPTGGFYDLAGNVDEWCADTFQFYSASPPDGGSGDCPNRSTSPNALCYTDPAAARVARGGSWRSLDRTTDLRSASRGGVGPTVRGNFALGFRCVRSR